MDRSSRIYSPEFVTSLFDEMSGTYGTVNSISSFGFCYFWRIACAKLTSVPARAKVLDLMSGMCELSIVLEKRNPGNAEFVSIDSSPAMCALANKAVDRQQLTNFEVVQGDALDTGLPDASVDRVVSTFGLKTFDPRQLELLSAETFRILKPGGEVAFLEISVPDAALLRVPYMAYLNHLIPIIGRILMGNPDNYRLLGEYTRRFKNCDESIKAFRAAGFTVTPKSFFFGCATGFHATK